MIDRILTGWNVRRFIYLFLGLYLVVQSYGAQEWFGVIIGTYFASMGLFSFGCASGHCATGFVSNDKSLNKTPATDSLNDIDFEEVK